MVTLTDAERLDITYAVVEGKPVVPLVEATVAARVEAERDRLLARIDARLAERITQQGVTDPGDPVRAGLIEGYRDARALVAEERAR